MSGEQQLQGPDLTAGVPVSSIPDGGMLVGHAQGQAVLLSRRGDEIFAISATCTHYSGPLGEGLIVGDTVRCPWHHACFSLRTGEALRAPALSPVSRWEHRAPRGHCIVIKERSRRRTARRRRSWCRDGIAHRRRESRASSSAPAWRGMLRPKCCGGAATPARSRWSAPIPQRRTIARISRRTISPGTAEESWLPLHSASFYKRHNIELLTGTRVKSVDVANRKVSFESGDTRDFDCLLLATGADPIVLRIPGADQKHVFYLRTLADSDAIIGAAQKGKRAVVIGASFIGLEVAASLRTRELDVHVVAPEAIPLVKVFGAALGSHVKALHEQHGVKFSLQRSVTAIGESDVTLDDGAKIASGSRGGRGSACGRASISRSRWDSRWTTAWSSTSSSSRAFRECTLPAISRRFRIARAIAFASSTSSSPSGRGSAPPQNMLGAMRRKYDDIPFFWSAHFGKEIRYVGHAPNADDSTMAGDLAKDNVIVAYRENGRPVAYATLGRDFACLEAERALEVDDTTKMNELTAR